MSRSPTIRALARLGPHRRIPRPARQAVERLGPSPTCKAVEMSTSSPAGQSNGLTLMAVHAHPEDEVLGTGGVLAAYAGQGVRTVLVTCTNGEQGDGPGGVKPGEPGHDAAQVAAVRLAEVRESAELLGVSHLELL